MGRDNYTIISPCESCTDKRCNRNCCGICGKHCDRRKENFTRILGNIVDIPCEIMVNAANGIGYMGGKRCVNKLCKGVSETMQFTTRGLIEREAKKAIKERGKMRCLIGLNPGDYYITGNCGLPCDYVFHAVTMRFPGSRSKKNWAWKCLCRLKAFCFKNGLYEIALPYIGCGNGALSKETLESMVNDMFPEAYWNIKLVDFVSEKQT